MDRNKNYYQVLHVQQDAPSEVIQVTYRTMMQKLKMHPDLGGDQGHAALINEAYAVLMDPVARAKYDAEIGQEVNLQSSAQHAKPSANKSHQNTVAPKRILNPNQCPFCELPHQLGATIKCDSVCSRCGSALYPAEKQVLEQNGKRIIQRIEKHWPLSFYTQWPITRGYIAKSQDVSLNGIQILSHTPLQEGQILKINSHMLDAVALVVNIRNDHTILRKRWRVGLQYLTLLFHQSHGTFIKVDA